MTTSTPSHTTTAGRILQRTICILALLLGFSETMRAQLPRTLQLQVTVKGDTARQEPVNMFSISLFHDVKVWGIALVGSLPSQFCRLTSSDRALILDLHRNLLHLATMAGLGAKVDLGCLYVARPGPSRAPHVDLDDQKPGGPTFVTALRG